MSAFFTPMGACAGVFVYFLIALASQAYWIKDFSRVAESSGEVLEVF